MYTIGQLEVETSFIKTKKINKLRNFFGRRLSPDFHGMMDDCLLVCAAQNVIVKCSVYTTSIYSMQYISCIN